MEKVVSAAHVERLVKEAYEGRKGVRTNCFMFADKLNGYADDGRLFYETHGDGLLLLLDMDDFYILYYHIRPDAELDFVQKDKPVIIEFHDSEHRHNKQNDAMIPYFEAAGFRHHNTIKRMTREYDQAAIDELLAQEDGPYEVITARPEHYGTIMDMLYSAFDPVKNLFPPRADIQRSLEAGEFLCVLDEAGKVICEVQVVYEDSSFYMLYVVTDPAWRGKNLSWQIRKVATLRAWEMGIKKRTGWALSDNTPGIRAAEKTGLRFDGAFTLHYIK
ncbi:MAG: hypothetical protein LBD12_05510 [Clostridiales Family XIII bacterium]|jgi:GNAT superfamily N-acetyltransferase|nr:hypothetical protein [Clostridiales Family XIII bacterium]